MSAIARSRPQTRRWSSAPRRYRRGRRGVVVPFPLDAAALPEARAFPRWRTALLVLCAVSLAVCSGVAAWWGFAAWELMVLGATACIAVWAAGRGEGDR